MKGVRDATLAVRVVSHARHSGGHVARCGVLGRASVDAGAEPLMWLDPDSSEAAIRFATLGLDCTADTVWRIEWSRWWDPEHVVEL